MPRWCGASGTERAQAPKYPGAVAGPVRQPRFRELVYRLRPRVERDDGPLPLVLARAQPGVVVETRAAHMDGRGRIWRILAVRGTPAELRTVEARFRRYRPRYAHEAHVLGRTRTHVFLWYAYRPGPAATPFSNTALAFRLLGRDTFVTDETRSGALTIRVLCRARPALGRYLDTVRARVRADYDLELLYLGPPRPSAAARLTPQEEAALAVARRLGYFDVPRRAGLAAVARALRVSASAAGYRLRRATAKLASGYLEQAA